MRVLLHETITGNPLRELPFVKCSWTTGVCKPDEVEVTMPGYVPEANQIRQLLVPRQTAVSIVRDDGVCLAAGIVGAPESGENDEGTPHISIPARGVESLFERRMILPPGYGPLVDAAGYPDTRYDTRFTGVDYGTMMQRLYKQAIAHPGGELPVAFETPRAGARKKGWAAVDGKPVQDAIEDISQLLGGVEWDWVPNVDERDRLSWSLITGRDALPEISSPRWHDWQSGGSNPAIRKLKEKVSPEFMASVAIFTGGKDDDRVLVSRKDDGGALIASRFPLSEIWDSSHSTVSEQATLDEWASGAIRDGSAPVQFWSFDVRAEQAPGVRHGDWCTVEVRGHYWIPDGLYERRIVEVSGDEEGDWLSVTIAGMQGW